MIEIDMLTALGVAAIAAIGPVGAVIVSYKKGASKLAEVHVLVNNRLDEALTEIADLKKEREERDARTMTVEVMPVEREVGNV